MFNLTCYIDQSITADAGPQLGQVCDLVNATEANTTHPQKILNALNLPNTMAGIEPTSYSSNCYARSRIIGHEGYLPRAYPIGDIRWSIAGTTGALHRWHIDSDGFGSFIEPITGAKLWFVARPIDSLSPDTFNATGLLMDDRFDLDLNGKGLFAIEMITLHPGSMLYVLYICIYPLFLSDMFSYFLLGSCGPIHYMPRTQFKILCVVAVIFMQHQQ